MDVNRVELVGHIAYDIERKQKANGGEWAILSLSTTGNDKRANIKKAESTPVILSVCVFNDELMKKIEELELRKGSYVRIVGQLFAKNSWRNNTARTYTSIATIEIDLEK